MRTHIIKLTASFGVTGLTSPFHTSLEELIKCADKAAYEAKSLGGNQVCVQFPKIELIISLPDVS